MEPKSFSASSLQVAETCLARYKAENIDKVPLMDNKPALTGTSVHWALEHFVKQVYIDKTAKWEDSKLFLDLYKIGYMDTFGSANLDTPEYIDGLDLAKKWYMRTKLADTVVSCEVKENFAIKTSIGKIPVNYIWDRCDMLEDGSIRVIDYKTIRATVSPEQLREKIQPRLYALAAQIKWPHAPRIWVTYDLLRHDPVGASFTKEENLEFYRYLQRAAERIIATDEDIVPETLNPECRFCARLATCDTMQKSIAGGSIMGIEPDAAAFRLLQVDSQMKALKQLADQLDAILLKEAEERDEYEWTTDKVAVKITARGMRSINSNAAAQILGPELTAKYGTFGIGKIDDIIKAEDLTDKQISDLKALIFKRYGEPSAKVSLKNPIEED